MKRKEDIFKKVQNGELTSEEAYELIGTLPNKEKMICNVEAFLVEKMSEILKINLSRIDVDKDLREYGFDSITLASFIDEINKKYQTNLIVLSLLEYPTVYELAGYMCEEYESEIRKYYYGNSSEEKIPDVVLREMESSEEDKMEVKANSESIRRINWNIQLIEQPIYLLHAAKSVDEEHLMNFWFDLKHGEIKDISASNISRNQLQILMDAGYKYLHLLIRSPKGFFVEVVIAGVGKPILMLAGAGTTATFGYQQIKEFSDQYQVIFLHLPSCGLSDGVEDLSLEGISEHIIETLQLLPIKFPLNLIGVSWGSVLAMKIAYMYSGLLETLVLVSGNTNRAAGRDLSKRVDMIDVHRGLEEELSLFLDGAKYMDVYNHSECVDPISFSRYIEFVNGPKSVDLSVFELLPDIKTPTLVVAGTEDKITDISESRLIYSRLDDAEYYEVKGAGHILFLTHAEEFNRVVKDFYKERL